MEMKLPQVERIVTETIDGKQVQKQIYADGSYGVRDGNSVERYFPDGKKQTYIKSADSFRLRKEVLPDGTRRRWHENGLMRYEELPDGTYRWLYDNVWMSEELPDGTKREWYKNGQMEYEELPDGTKTRYNDQGKVTYHATKGVEDTIVYLAKKRVIESVTKGRLEKEDKLSKGKDERVILPKMNKLSKAIEMKKAIRKVKKDLGR